jgi:2,3-dihydroxy-p-cumate/2,3-dihydroxybenzoate 3,4-dioxygenase
MAALTAMNAARWREHCVHGRPVTGAILDFYAGMAQMDSPHSPTVAKIQHLSHVVLGTPRYREAVDFYENVLNFRTSDEIDGRINLMRCFPNPYHHSFGIAYSERNCLHHLNFMVSDSDDLERAKSRFEHNNVPMVWGGLHPPSGNVFLFSRSGRALAQYGYGMELFPEVGARAAVFRQTRIVRFHGRTPRCADGRARRD